MTSVRENWRVILLVVLLIGSTVALISPTGQNSDAGTLTENETQRNISTENASTGNSGGLGEYVNLKYGLELQGGTSVRAPLTGVSASGVEFTADNESVVIEAIANKTGVDEVDVRIRTPQGADSWPATGSVEIYARGVSAQQLGEVLRSTNGVETEEMSTSSDVTKATYDEAESVLEAKIVQSGLSGGQVTQATGANGQQFIVVKVPNSNQSEVTRLIGDRGLIRILAVYPENPDQANSTHAQETIVTQRDIRSVAQTTESNGGYGVPVTLTDEAAEEYVQTLGEAGYLEENAYSNCEVARTRTGVRARGFCLLTYQDDEMLHGGGIAQGLAEQLQSGQFQNDPTVVLSTRSRSEAQDLQIILRAGAMPTRLAVEEGTTTFLSPGQASDFKLFSLLIGILTVLAVALTVTYRYQERGIAIPMTFTALSEVWILLGFVAVVQLPLDLSHIAGLIAVVGTGVDDLIIITDEVFMSGDVSTAKVFDSRFKKAFWVIGIAAATTIIAMSPLAVLSLGDLQGFAIVTIVGVLIGVLVTRPAYGDILRLQLNSGED